MPAATPAQLLGALLLSEVRLGQRGLEQLPLEPEQPQVQRALQELELLRLQVRRLLEFRELGQLPLGLEQPQARRVLLGLELLRLQVRRLLEFQELELGLWCRRPLRCRL